MTEVQATMLISPGLAAKNTVRGNFWPTSVLYSAEDRGREASWADWFITRGGGKAEPGSTEGWAWPSCARRQGTPATGSLCSPGVPSSGHFKHSLRLGDALLLFQTAI